MSEDTKSSGPALTQVDTVLTGRMVDCELLKPFQPPGSDKPIMPGTDAAKRVPIDSGSVAHLERNKIVRRLEDS